MLTLCGVFHNHLLEIAAITTTKLRVLIVRCIHYGGRTFLSFTAVELEGGQQARQVERSDWYSSIIQPHLRMPRKMKNSGPDFTHDAGHLVPSEINADPSTWWIVICFIARIEHKTHVVVGGFTHGAVNKCYDAFSCIQTYNRFLSFFFFFFFCLSMPSGGSDYQLKSFLTCWHKLYPRQNSCLPEKYRCNENNSYLLKNTK